jgi:hypothetical protein
MAPPKKVFCLRGHPKSGDNLLPHGDCKACKKLWRERNRASLLTYHKIYHSEHKEEEAAKQRERYVKDSEFRKRMLERTSRYNLEAKGWTPEAVAEYRIKQEGKCAICQEKFIETPHGDHEHTFPPKRRELLCGACNKAIGMLKDSPKICEAAAAYLRKWGKT